MVLLIISEWHSFRAKEQAGEGIMIKEVHTVLREFARSDRAASWDFRRRKGCERAAGTGRSFADHRSNKPSVRARMPHISNQKRSPTKQSRQTALGLRHRRCLQCPPPFGWHLEAQSGLAASRAILPGPTELGAAEQLIEGVLAIIIGFTVFGRFK